MKAIFFLVFSLCISFIFSAKPYVLVMAERGTDHEGFTAAALDWLEEMSEELDFSLKVVENGKELKEGDVMNSALVFQLNHPPYSWSDVAAKEFEEYIDEGKGSYIGMHHATLLGEFDGYEMWDWFSDFMGGIRYENYIPQLADGTVQVEDMDHPVMKGVKRTFIIPNDEWYIYDKDPRKNVRVLAHVDESSYIDKDSAPEWGPDAYRPMPTMGDHPVIWTNEKKKAKNVYFQFGHHKDLLDTPAWKQMMTNALKWCLDK